MNFDRVAPHYRRLETLAFGAQLQKARSAFVRQISAPRRALVVGEGDGRFLEVLRRAHPELQIECLDASARMLALARSRVGDAYSQFLQADIREVAFPADRYDLIVTHFFLDCFHEGALREVVEKLSAAAMPGAAWLIADFQLPPRGWWLQSARILIATMYFFFRVVAGIEARRLIDVGPLLSAHGWRLTNEIISTHGLVRSQCWTQRTPGIA